MSNNAVSLADYIDQHYAGNQSAFARSQDTSQTQVARWLAKNYQVVDGILYSPRRSLIVPDGVDHFRRGPAS